MTKLKFSINREKRTITYLPRKEESRPLRILSTIHRDDPEDIVERLCYLIWLIEESKHYNHNALCNALLFPYFILHRISPADPAKRGPLITLADL